MPQDTASHSAPTQNLPKSTDFSTVYKVYDMVFFDYFWLLKFRFFQYYYPEAGDVMEGRKYGFNIKSQLLKLLVIFPAASALAAWVCSLLRF